MSKDELIDQAIKGFQIIEHTASRLTTGNVSHERQSIRGTALRHIEFLEKHKNDKL